MHSRSRTSTSTLHSLRSTLHALRSSLFALRSSLFALRSPLSAPRHSHTHTQALTMPILLLLASLLFLPDSLVIQEWPVPWEDTRPRDPYVDGQGRVWFVGQQGNYIAYLEPESGEFKRYEILEGTHPHNLIV